MEKSADRDHLFISYAWENADFARWLYQKLTAEGYLVWIDQEKLLGGEPFPVDIEVAIKARTFRVLALMSRVSIGKPNPRRERVMASKVGQDLGWPDFMIPLNVDGISSSELDFVTTENVFLMFAGDWAGGFQKLLKKLDSIGTPKNAERGRERVCQWFGSQVLPEEREEKLWTNILPVNEIPKAIRKFRIVDVPAGTDLQRLWAYQYAGPDLVWAFTPPPVGYGITTAEIDAIEWEKRPLVDGARTVHILMALLRKSMDLFCLQKGLARTPNGRSLYFPSGLLEKDKVKFLGPQGTPTTVMVSGKRLAYRREDRRIEFRYHIAPSFSLSLDHFGQPVVRVVPKLYLTDIEGRSLRGDVSLRRRKKISKSWWNHQWVSRTLAIASWLADGKDEVTILETEEGAFRLFGRPVSLICDKGIDESKLKPVPEEDEFADGQETFETVAVLPRELTKGGEDGAKSDRASRTPA